MSSCFTCLNCGRENPIKGHSYTNKYCNNKCQSEHRSRTLVSQWQNGDTKPWAKIPEWVKKHLVDTRGRKCERCGGIKHNGKDIPLVVEYKDNDTYHNNEENLELICPNCRAQK